MNLLTEWLLLLGTMLGVFWKRETRTVPIRDQSCLRVAFQLANLSSVFTSIVYGKYRHASYLLQFWQTRTRAWKKKGTRGYLASIENGYTFTKIWANFFFFKLMVVSTWNSTSDGFQILSIQSWADCGLGQTFEQRKACKKNRDQRIRKVIAAENDDLISLSHNQGNVRIKMQ